MSDPENTTAPKAGTNSVQTPTDDNQNGFNSILPPSEVNHNQTAPPSYSETVKDTNKKVNEQEYLLQNRDKVPEVTYSSEKDAEAQGTAVEDDGRETWSKKADFLLSIIGFAVDLANVWRFPYFCYKNGGGAFLIPYFLMLIFGAIPLFLMELALGQFHRQGAVSVWKIAPIFKGIGICQCVIAYYVAFYYNVIIAWSLYFLIASLTKNLPWMSCGNPWNTVNCLTGGAVIPSSQDSSSNITTSVFLGNSSYTPMLSNLTYTLEQPNMTYNVLDSARFTNSVSSAAEYYERQVLGLHLSSGLTDLGSPRWQLTLCLVGVFIMLYLALWKGVKSSGKVVWVTATMPYVVLSILLFRGMLLPGAKEGVLFYITPNVDRLGDPQVWIDAAIQIFYSVGAGFGVHIAYASYNKFHNNFYRDAIATACVNSFTSMFSGFVIFCYLGYMAQKMGRTIEDVATEGPGLVFVVYPEAIATLPGSVFWAIIFFLMLITLGLDSAMGGLEAVLTGLTDETKQWLGKYKYSREFLTLCVCASAFLFALQNITNGGMYMFTLWDTFAAGTSILFGVWSLVVAIGWFYGMDQFCEDFKKMLGFRPNMFLRICWKFVSPVFIFVIIISSIVSFKPLIYKSYTMGEYEYPGWANGVGWLIAASSMLAIPVWAVIYIIKTPGTLKQRIAKGISPINEHRAIMKGENIKRFKPRHWITI